MADKLHPYDVQELDYMYVLTQQRDNTVRIDNIGYHTATATDTFDTLDCDKGYQSCLQHLLIKDRAIEAWGDPTLFESFSMSLPVYSEFEPHKHPKTLKRKILRGEQFNWWTKTSYVLRTPTKEIIDETRSQYWWHSKTEPLIPFYHHAREIIRDNLVFYVPHWLTPYAVTNSYDEESFDSEILNERTLLNEGLHIVRSIHKADPREHLKNIQCETLAFPDWTSEYTAIALTASGTHLGPTASRAVMTVGILSPEETIWERNQIT